MYSYKRGKCGGVSCWRKGLTQTYGTCYTHIYIPGVHCNVNKEAEGQPQGIASDTAWRTLLSDAQARCRPTTMLLLFMLLLLLLPSCHYRVEGRNAEAKARMGLLSKNNKMDKIL